MAKAAYMNKEEHKKLFEEATKPVVCNSLHDIQMALEPFTRAHSNEEIIITCELSEQADGKPVKYNATGKSKNASLRQTLLDGLAVVKKRIETMSKMREAIESAKSNDESFSTSLQAWDVDKVRFNVDTLIERKLGAKRNGILIRWELPDGVFEYDAFSGKLYEITP